MANDMSSDNQPYFHCKTIKRNKRNRCESQMFVCQPPKKMKITTLELVSTLPTIYSFYIHTYTNTKKNDAVRL